MNPSCTVSVAICTRDRAASLERALRSLERAARAAERRVSIEILVVDNGSTDRTAEVARRFGERIALRILSEPRVGLSHARNAAMAAARGTWIAFTDDDAEVDPRWLLEVGRAIERHPQMDFFGGRSLVRWDGTPPAWLSTPDLPFIKGLLCHFDEGDVDFEIRDDAQLPIGVNMGLRREMAAVVGSFRTDLGPGTPARGEETDFLSRARQNGFRGWYLSAATVHHHAETKRFAPLALYRHGLAKGRGERLRNGTGGSLGAELHQLCAAAWLALRGKHDWMRVCIVNAGLQRGARQPRSADRKPEL